LQVRLPDPFNVDAQNVVALNTGAAQRRVPLLRRVAPVARWCDLHHLADRLDTVGMAVPVDESPHGLKLRPSSAWAKKRARQAQDLVRLAQLAHFSFQRLDALLFGSGWS
jgi:hypothetical protein